MIRTDVFEGFADFNPGWEFDHPTYMVKPALAYTDSYQGEDALIEDYMIDTSVNGELPGDEDLDERHSVLCQFALAKKGKAREGIVYWRRVIEWDTETSEYTVIENLDSARPELQTDDTP